MTNNIPKQGDQLSSEIKSLVSKVIKIPEEKIDVNANIFTELGVDSLLGVEIFASLDKKYGLDVPEEKLKDINTLNDIINLVREMLPRKSASG
jgi:acyl carrier protein